MIDRKNLNGTFLKKAAIAIIMILSVHKMKYPLNEQNFLIWQKTALRVVPSYSFIYNKYTKEKWFHKKPQGRPQSVVTRSPLPPLLAGRPLSVPGFGDVDDGGSGDDGGGDDGGGYDSWGDDGDDNGNDDGDDSRDDGGGDGWL